MNKCRFCTKDSAPYTCPKCNYCYCSVACYKSKPHDRCTEEFYRECVMSELNEPTTSTEDTNRMLEILKRVSSDYHEDDVLAASASEGVYVDKDSDDDSIDSKENQSLEDRMAGVDLNGEVDSDELWSRLSKIEKDEFEKLLDKENTGTLLNEWEPWWSQNRLINVIGDSANQNLTYPTVLPDIPKLRQIMPKTNPSPAVQYNLINILYAYAFTVRYHNGNHHNLVVESAEMVKDISNNIGKNHNYDDVDMAVLSALGEAREMKMAPCTPEFLSTVVMDIIQIIQGPRHETMDCKHILLVLADLQRLLLSAMKLTKSSNHKKTVNKASEADGKVSRRRKLFSSAEKKMSFMLSWVVEHGLQLGEFVPKLQLLYDSQMLEHLSYRRMEEEVTAWRKEGQPGRKMQPFIQELN